MKGHFEKFIKNIELTSLQKEDAKTKYKGVCTLLHSNFYESEYSGNTKFLFGSYKNKTAIRPMTPDQDVDVLFKIPEHIYKKYKNQENGQSNLLTKIKEILKTKYSTTDGIKNWGKVVLVEFADNTHNIEILPAYENDDETFIIPNTENGGSWDLFNPRDEINNFLESNNENNHLTRTLIKQIKRWNLENKTLSLKSYQINNFVIDFLNNYNFLDYPFLILDFFKYINNEDNSSFTETALDRSQKAFDFYEEGEIEKAILEYRKIFGGSFPKNININKSFIQIASNEEFIEDLYTIEINYNISFSLEGRLEKELNGYRKYLSQMQFLPKEKSIIFEVTNLTGINREEIFVLWKVRNYGEDAERQGGLRGSIFRDGFTRKESSLYTGEHFVECYLILNNKCVARKRIEVPIK